MRFTLFAMNWPKMKNGNQRKWTSIVNIGSCMMTGPGHSPPSPHPSPKQAAPPTSFQSITLLMGLNNF